MIQVSNCPLLLIWFVSFEITSTSQRCNCNNNGSFETTIRASEIANSNAIQKQDRHKLVHVSTEYGYERILYQYNSLYLIILNDFRFLVQQFYHTYFWLVYSSSLYYTIFIPQYNCIVSLKHVQKFCFFWFITLYQRLAAFIQSLPCEFIYLVMVRAAVYSPLSLSILPSSNLEQNFLNKKAS